MATQAQIDANRANAQHSTGPRTPQGKQTSSLNHTKFGLFSRRLLLPGEDPAELEALRDGIYRRFQPADEVERVYVERFLAAAWHFQRALGAEVRLFAGWSEATGSIEDPSDLHTLDESARALERVRRHIASLERSMDRALAEITRLQKARREADEAEKSDQEIDQPETTPILQNEPKSSASARIEIVKSNPIPAPTEANRQFEPNLPPSTEPTVSSSP
jgi:hypothetical protein